MRWWECPECWQAYHWFMYTRRRGSRGALVHGRMERQGYGGQGLYPDGQTFAYKVGGQKSCKFAGQSGNGFAEVGQGTAGQGAVRSGAAC